MDGWRTLGQLAMIHTIGGRLDVWKYIEDAHLESEKPITERDGTIPPESRTDVGGFFFFFRLPTGGCQSGDGASQTKPSIRFPSCKAQCDIVPRLFYKENMRWLRGGKGDPLPGVTNNHNDMVGGGGILAHARCPHPNPPPKQYSSTASARRVSCHRVSQDCDVPQY